MRVVDTSAWIEWLADSKTGAKLEADIPDSDSWIVPTIVLMEVAKWLEREMDRRILRAIIAFARECHVVSLDANLAIRAAEVSKKYKLSTADAIIYATALEHDADLLTCDSHFEGLERVVLVGKVA